jgi:hypothetical protein
MTLFLNLHSSRNIKTDMSSKGQLLPIHKRLYYPGGTGGCANCGYGGSGYDTADWNGNTSYYTSGLTRDIKFQSQNYLG